MNIKLTALFLTGFLLVGITVFAQTPSEQVYTAVETPAVYPGNKDSFQHYLDANMRYPDEARQKNITAKIYVSFIVEKDGTLTDIKLLNSVGYGCDEEALRLIKSSQKWVPGRQNGALVRQLCHATITFSASRAHSPLRVNNEQVGLASQSEIRIDEPVGNTDIIEPGPNEIFTAVEHSAEYPGGIEAFFKYMAKNLRYPAIAKANNVSGKVFVSFVIEKDGRLTDLKVMRGIGSGCDEEALRVIKASEKWLPGKQNNKEVRQQYIVPVTFGGTSTSATLVPSKAVSISSPQASIASSSATDRQNMIYTIAEEQAAYPGGPLAFLTYLGKNLKYPVAARDAGVQGKVFITFVIERDGILSDIKVLRGVRADIDTEAIRVVKASGKWIPGKYRNSAVRQQYTVPVSFDLY